MECSWATRLIKAKARQLVGRYGYQIDDLEDIQQDLWFALLERGLGAASDPPKLISKAVNDSVADLVRHRMRVKRGDSVEIVPLDCLGNLSAPTDSRDLAIDLERLLADIEVLDEHSRYFIEQLENGLSVREIAQKFNISHKYARNWLYCLRIIFRSAGLHEYL